MKLPHIEHELLKMYSQGCNESLGKLYIKYWSLFKNVSKKYMCCEEAEDLVHSVFEKLLLMPIEKRIQIFSKVSSVKNYFYTTIKFAAIDYLRKRKIDCIGIEQATHSVEEEEMDEFSTLSLQYKNVGLSNLEITFFEEYLNGSKPKSIAQKYQKGLSNVKGTLTNAKKKILIFYKEKANQEE